MATSERSEEAVDDDQVDTVELSDPQIRDDRSDVCLAQRKANNEWARRRDVDSQLPETQMFPYNGSTTTTISMTDQMASASRRRCAVRPFRYATVKNGASRTI